MSDFYTWSEFGSGRGVLSEPVLLEGEISLPEYLYTKPAVDDGRQETWLSRLFQRPAADKPQPVALEEPAAFRWSGHALDCTISVKASGDTETFPEEARRFLVSLATGTDEVSFELVGTDGRVESQFGCSERDRHLLERELTAFHPTAVLEARDSGCLLTSNPDPGAQSSVIAFGLGSFFVRSLRRFDSYRLDPLAPIIAALGSVEAGTTAIFQVLLTPTRQPWGEAAILATTDTQGRCLFADAPDLASAAADFASEQVFAATARVAVISDSFAERWRIVKEIASGLAQYERPGSNWLVPLETLDNELGYVLKRLTPRTGMLVTASALAGLVHIPNKTVVDPAFVRLRGVTRPCPREAQAEGGILLGSNQHLGSEVAVHIGSETRIRHCHVVGASGTGKSTLLASMILQDIKAGRGVAVLEPHGDLVDEVLRRFPEERVDDLILFDPSDPDFAVGWNILEANSEAEREMLASDLVSVFQRLSTSWGDQMSSVLGATVLTLLASDRRPTLADLRQFLIDRDFRADFLRSVEDPYLRSYWDNEFKLVEKRNPHGPILTRLDTVLRSRLVREVVTVREGGIDFRSVLEGQKIFLARLSQGAIGRENASLLGSLLVSKLHQVALGRQDQAAGERSPYFVYLDEFHELATPSMATLFSGVRKYGLGLTVAHQDLYQLRQTMPEVERAVLSNAHTRICFRVGEADARQLDEAFAHFDREELIGLSLGEAVARVGTSRDDFNLRTAPLPALLEPADVTALRRRSFENFGVARAQLTAPSPQQLGQQPTECSAPPEPSRELPSAPRQKRAPRSRPKPPPADVGSGGAEHTYLQSLLSEWAQSRGYTVAVEEELAAGGRVDLVFRKGDRAVACEISVTTSVKHEHEAVERCLQGTFDRVLVVSRRKRFLKDLQQSLESLPQAERPRVHVGPPEDVLAHLAAGEEVSERRVAGYKVRRRVADVTPEERERRRNQLAKTIAKRLRGGRSE